MGSLEYGTYYLGYYIGVPYFRKLQHGTVIQPSKNSSKELQKKKKHETTLSKRIRLWSMYRKLEGDLLVGLL